MKIPSFLLVSILSLVLAPASLKASVTLTGFGTGQYLSTFTDFTTEIQTPTTYQVIGNDFGQSAYGDLQPSTVDITGSTSYLTLTATFSGTATSVFNIELFDTIGNSRLYKANFSSFTQNVPTSVDFSFFSQTGSFNNTVSSLGFTTSGTGSTVSIIMDNLTANPVAAPEPSSIALLGLGMVGLLSYRRPVSRR